MSQSTAFINKSENLDWAVLLSRNPDVLQQGSEEAEQQLEDIFELIKRAKISANDEYASVENLITLFRLSQLVAELKNGYLLGAEDQIKQLEETVNIQEDEIRRLHTMVGGDAALELQHFEEERKVYEAKAELALSKMSEAEERYEDEKTRNFALNETLRSLRSERDKLQQQNASIMSELQQLRNQGVEKSLREREDDERVQTMLKEKTIEAVRLQKDLSYLQQEHSKLQQDATSVISELEATVTELGNLDREKKELELVVKETDAKVTTVEKENEYLKQELVKINHAYEATSETRQIETEELHTTITRAAEKAQNWQRHAEQQQEEIKELKEKVETLKKEYSHSKLDKLRRELRERESLIQSLTGKLDEARNDMELLVKDWESLQTLVKENSTAKVQEAMATSSAQIQALQSKLTLQKSREKQAHTRVKSLRQELDKVETELLDTQQMLHNVSTEVYGLPEAMHEVKLLKRQMQLREQDITKWTRRVTDLQSEVDRLREENDSYREMEFAASGVETGRLRGKGDRAGRSKKRQHRAKRARGEGFDFDEEKIETIEKYVTVLSKTNGRESSKTLQSRPSIENPFLDRLVSHLESVQQKWQEAEKRVGEEHDGRQRLQTLNRFLQALIQDLVLYAYQALPDSNEDDKLSQFKQLVEQITHNEHCFENLDTSMLTAHLSAQTHFISGEHKKLVERIENTIQRFLSAQQEKLLDGQVRATISDWASPEHANAVENVQSAQVLALESLRQLQTSDSVLDSVLNVLTLREKEQSLLDTALEEKIQAVAIAAQAVEYSNNGKKIGIKERYAGAINPNDLAVPEPIKALEKNREGRRTEALLHAISLLEQENSVLKVNFSEIEQSYLELIIKTEFQESEMRKLADQFMENLESTVPLCEYEDCLSKLNTVTLEYSNIVRRQELLLGELDDSERELALLQQLLSTKIFADGLEGSEQWKEKFKDNLYATLSQEELVSRLRQAVSVRDSVLLKLELAQGKVKVSHEMENRAKERCEELEKMVLGNVDVIYRTQQELNEMRTKYENGATSQEFEKIRVNYKAEREQVRQWRLKALSYQKMADYTMQQLLLTRGMRKMDELEKRMLQATIQELQMEDDSKCVIGKLHQQIIVLKIAESKANEQFRSLKTRTLGLENQFRQSQIVATELFGACQQAERGKAMLKSRLSVVIDRQRTLLIGSVTLTNFDALLKKWMELQLVNKKLLKQNHALDGEVDQLLGQRDEAAGLLQAQRDVLEAFKQQNVNLEPVLTRHLDYTQAKLEAKRLRRKVDTLSSKLQQQQRELEVSLETVDELERLNLSAESKLDEERQKWCQLVENLPTADLSSDKFNPKVQMEQNAAKTREIQIVETVKPDPRVPEMLRTIDQLGTKIKELELEQIAKENKINELQTNVKMVQSQLSGSEKSSADSISDAQRVRRLQSQLSSERRAVMIAKHTINVLKNQLDLHDQSTTKISKDLYKVLEDNILSSKGTPTTIEKKTSASRSGGLAM